MLEEQEIKKGGEERQIVIFNLGKEEFGVNITEVREIIRMEQITGIPNTAEYIEGVINLRGGIIVVIDLAMKLGLPSRESDNNTRIIVIEVNNNTVGMVVDSATEVLRLKGDQIEPPPSVITEKINTDYIEGVGILDERLLILLDLAKVLQAKEVEHITKMQKKKEEEKAAEEKKEAEKKKSEEEEKSKAVSEKGAEKAAAAEEVKARKKEEAKKAKKK